MSAQSFLIMTSQYLKDVSVIGDNADDKVMTSVIILVQRRYLLPILGTDLFNEIAGQIEADTVTADNQTLLDNYILPLMQWYCLSEATPAIKYRYMNKGVMIKGSDNSTPADLQEIKFLIDRWENNAKVFAEDCTRFLRAHTTTYPLFCANTDCDDIKPNKTNYRTSIYLGDSELTDKQQRDLNIGKY